jgi:hypothetical protein
MASNTFECPLLSVVGRVSSVDGTGLASDGRWRMASKREWSA